MNLREFYLERRRAEYPAFVRVLDALPADRLAYRAHERSPSAAELAWKIVHATRTSLDVATTHRGESNASPPPPLAEMREHFAGWSEELVARVTSMDDAAWDQPARFFHKGALVLEQPAGAFLWFILFDSIHHRGQLAAYLRPMGGKVPSIYGPSADDRGR
ncbi:MAG TPA: DinB family protein [bacterium]